MTTDKRPHVVIVGAGFGGLAAARGLRNADVDITLIDKRNHHLFSPCCIRLPPLACHLPKSRLPFAA